MLGPIILIHELGHFVFAKWAGVRVEEFGLGFPPRLLKLWRGQGYLKIGSTRVIIPRGFKLPPELSRESWAESRDDDKSYEVNAITLRRDDGSYVLRSISVLDPAMDDLRPERRRVDEGVHMRGALTELEPGTLYSLNWFPLGAFVKMTGEDDPSDSRSLAAQPKRWRIAVLAAGAVLNIIVALLLLVGAYATGIPDQWQVQVSQVEPATPAAEAGLQPGDVILAVDGEHIEDGLLQLRDIIRAAPERTIELAVLRGEERLTLTATPRRQPEGHGFLGIMMASWPDRNSVKHYGLLQALSSGFNDTVTAIEMTLGFPTRVVKGDVTPQEARPIGLPGIIGILTLSLQQSIEWKLAFPALQTASFVSLALGLTNLLPLPALDGGRILFVLIEAVRGRRVSPKREAVVHFVGMVILMSLMTLVMIQDLFNPIIPWSLLGR